MGGDCRLRGRGYLYFSAARYPLSVLPSRPLLLLRSFISESIRSRPGSRYRLYQKAPARVYRFLALSAALPLPSSPRLPAFQAVGIVRFMPGGSPLIDHCINNNSAIIVIYRDVLPSAPLQRRMKGRCIYAMQKVYLLLYLYNTHRIRGLHIKRAQPFSVVSRANASYAKSFRVYETPGNGRSAGLFRREQRLSLGLISLMGGRAIIIYLSKSVYLNDVDTLRVGERMPHTSRRLTLTTWTDRTGR